MAKETINSIRDAELKAQEILKKAEAEKNGFLDKAKEEGAAFAKDLIDKAQAKAKDELAKVEETRTGALDEAQEKAEGIIAGLTSSAADKFNAAVDMVIEEIT